MKWSKSLIPTLREVPADAVVPSHQLMLRAGLVGQVASGAYSYLPLGWRVLHKVMNIIREEMNKADAVEVFLPSLQPIEWWEQTGRKEAYGENLFVVEDRHGKEAALGPTHEEVITMLVKSYVNSYRQLPLNLYQIQTKFRDEFRPRYGVLRSREFQMKDAYSFHLDLDSLNDTYEAMYKAYSSIYTRCGIPFVVVEAEAGPIGGNASHEFMIPSPTGEDIILSSDQGNYAANVEKCEIGDRASDLTGEPTGELDTVHTPDQASIEDVCKFMKVKAKNMLKTLVLQSEQGWIVAVVRGDHELNEAKLRLALGGLEVEMADEREAKEAGFTIGFVGPHVAGKIKLFKLVIDPDAAQAQFWASGANEVDHHVKHFNWQRDVIEALGDKAESVLEVADIRNAVANDPSPKNDGGVLVESHGIEVGHIFKLGTKYSKSLGLSVLDENQAEQDVIMGCYGIGVNRILASAIEADGGSDDNGVIWPMSIAPYQVVITPIRNEAEMAEVAEKLYHELSEMDVDVLYDDRDERPGVKFKDADLIGIPIRITVGDRGLKTGQVEFKLRSEENAEMLGVDHVIQKVADTIDKALNKLEA